MDLASLTTSRVDHMDVFLDLASEDQHPLPFIVRLSHERLLDPPLTGEDAGGLSHDEHPPISLRTR